MSHDQGEDGRNEPEGADLEWRDYLALAVAALETVLLPLVVFAVVLVVLFLVLR